MILKANKAQRARLLQSVQNYTGRVYGTEEPLSLYDDFEAFASERRGHYVAGCLIRFTGDMAELHVLASDATFASERDLREFLTFMHHIEATRGVKLWTTYIRVDRPEVSDAARTLGFRPTECFGIIQEYMRSVI